MPTPQRSTESGIVDRVLVTTNAQGLRFVKVRMGTATTTQICDKFALHHGQKGTVGITYQQDDMPLMRKGVMPDLIVSPHAIASRITIAHLIEWQLSKVAAVKRFEGFYSVLRLLRTHGYQLRGFEVIVVQIFLRPTYYQHLWHMVNHKPYAQVRRPMQILMRQSDGGLRFDEMKPDCILTLSASAFLKEQLFKVADPIRVDICDTCALMTAIA
jgi:DNA-directed RNA polymerase II subunit RPB2